MDLARDRQSNCSGCGAPIYWVKIKKRDGTVKPMPLSEALAKRDGDQVYLSGHHADCPKAGQFGGREAAELYSGERWVPASVELHGERLDDGRQAVLCSLCGEEVCP